MNGNTLTLPQRPAGNHIPRRKEWSKGGSRPKAPSSGHQIDLNKLKGKASIEVDFINIDERIKGRLVDADRYTVTVSVQREGHSQPVVIFKHAIMCYTVTPDVEKAENE